MALARMAAPHLKAGSEKILPKSFTSKDGDKPSKFEEVCHVASGGLKGNVHHSYVSKDIHVYCIQRANVQSLVILEVCLWASA